MRSLRSCRLGVYLLVLLCIGLSVSAGGAVALPGNGLIAFVRDGDVWVMEPDGSSALNLTQGRVGFPQAVAWSPDGIWLAIQGLSGTGAKPYLMRADGSDLAGVTIGTGNMHLGCWLGPDRLVVRDQRQGAGGVDDSDLFVVRPDGTEVDRLTADGGAKGLSTSSCAPATGTVFYLRQDSGGLGAYRVGQGGAGPARLVLEGVSAPLSAPIPSADGSMIAVNDGNGVAVAQASGGTARRISTTPATGLMWSTAGEQLGFVHVIQGACDRFGCAYTFDVHALASDGSGERELTSPHRGDPGMVSWSPDAERILFSTGSFLQVMNPDGTCETRLLDQPVFPAAAVAWQPLEGSRSAPLTPIRCTDLGVRGESEPRAVAAGGTAILRFAVANDGTEPATDARASLTIEGPGELVSTEASPGSCSLATLTCLLGSIPPRADAALTVIVRSTVAPATTLADLPRLGGVIAVTAVVAAVEADPHPDNVGVAAAGASACTGVAIQGDPEVRGTGGRDVLCGYGGTDFLRGLGGGDVLSGYAGNDDLEGGPGADEISGAGHDDRIDAGRGDDYVDAGSGHDRVTGGPGSDEIDGGGDRDRIEGGAGEDDLDGGGSNDRLTGGPGRDRIQAGYGYDVVLARDGERDRITCGGRFDRVYADRIDRVGRDCELVRRRPS